MRAGGRKQVFNEINITPLLDLAAMAVMGQERPVPGVADGLFPDRPAAARQSVFGPFAGHVL